MALSHTWHRWFVGVICLCAATSGCATPGGPGWMSSLPGGFGQNRPSPQLQLAWGRVQERDGNFTDARVTYNSVLKDDPSSVEAIMGLARLDALAGRPEQAEQEYLQAIQLAPANAVTHAALGQFYVDQQRWPEALAALEKAASAAPDDKSYRFQLAVAVTKSGNIPEGLAQFTQLSGAAEAHYNVGRILYDGGDIAGSEAYFAAAVAKNPKLHEAQTWLIDVRHERESKHALAHGGAAPAPAAAPAARPAVVANGAAGPLVASPAATQIPAQPAPSPARQTVSTAGSAAPQQPSGLPPASVQTISTVAPAAEGAAGWNARQEGADHPLPSAAGQLPPAVPSGVTPQQYEQMRNQRLAQ